MLRPTLCFCLALWRLDLGVSKSYGDCPYWWEYHLSTPASIIYGEKWDLKVLWNSCSILWKTFMMRREGCPDDACCVHVWVLSAVCGWRFGEGGRKSLFQAFFLVNTHGCVIYFWPPWLCQSPRALYPLTGPSASEFFTQAYLFISHCLQFFNTTLNSSP